MRTPAESGGSRKGEIRHEQPLDDRRNGWKGRAEEKRSGEQYEREDDGMNNKITSAMKCVSCLLFSMVLAVVRGLIF